MQVIEIGKGSKVKYELDKKTGLIKVIVNAILRAIPFCLLQAAKLFLFVRLIVFFTLQLCTLTTMASSLVLYVRTMIPWMS